MLVLTVWAFDTFAYLSGRTFKRGRFLNHISPNKTWSGVIGGTVAADRRRRARWPGPPGSGWPGGLRHGPRSSRSPASRATSPSRCSSAPPAPRTRATLIPGHGGILDRVDSFLFAAPVVFGYLLIVAG